VICFNRKTDLVTHLKFGDAGRGERRLMQEQVAWRSLPLAVDGNEGKTLRGETVMLHCAEINFVVAHFSSIVMMVSALAKNLSSPLVSVSAPRRDWIMYLARTFLANRFTLVPSSLASDLSLSNSSRRSLTVNSTAFVGDNGAGGGRDGNVVSYLVAGKSH
jgi:hypothetical protein